MRPLLSAAIIVRDEADFLRSCLGSIAASCDEIVVVDTGSTDDSRAVARSFGAVTDDLPWDDDFAAARNRALDLATGEWILYIDADERFEDVDPAAVRRELREAHDAVSLLVRFRARPIWTPYREFRLWRHRDDIRFVGRIHETMVGDIRRVADEEGLAIRDSRTVSICHDGYEGDQSAKHARNLPLLERRVVELPDRCYLWNHLASIREALGDAEGAVAAWTTGLELIRRRGLADRTDVLCYAGLGFHLLAKGEDIAALVEECLAVAPWYPAAHWLAAANHRAQGRHGDAVPHLRWLLAMGRDPEDPALAHHRGMFGEWAWRMLGECLYALGDLTGAVEVYREASAALPDDLELRTKAAALGTMLARSGR